MVYLGKSLVSFLHHAGCTYPFCRYSELMMEAEACCQALCEADAEKQALSEGSEQSCSRIDVSARWVVS